MTQVIEKNSNFLWREARYVDIFCIQNVINSYHWWSPQVIALILILKYSQTLVKSMQNRFNVHVSMEEMENLCYLVLWHWIHKLWLFEFIFRCIIVNFSLLLVLQQTCDFCAMILIMIKSTNEIDLIVKLTFEKCFDHGYVRNQR